MTKRGNQRPRRVCLVTNELFPLAPGGIGRLVSNWIRQNDELSRPVSIDLLLPASMADKKAQIEALCEPFGVGIWFCASTDAELTLAGQTIAATPADKWDYFQALKVSYDYFLALLRLWKSGVHFDVVEFPDYGGWGACTIEAKRARLCLDSTEIAVRLHSTYGLIVDNEPFYHGPSGWAGAMFDLERFSLRHADRVVGHISSIVERNKAFYRFDDAWGAAVTVETPPIYLDDAPALRDDLAKARRGRRFTFSSRLQPFKRPDLFVKAACLLLREEFDEPVEALVLSYGWDRAYIERLKQLVPVELRDKIVFVEGVRGTERERILNDSIIVIPSEYESYCLFAYESAAAGRSVLLRRSCLAFGHHDVWKHDTNCLMFGDTPEELASVMKQALSWSPRQRVITTPDTPYWAKEAAAGSAPRPRERATPPVHVVIHGVKTDTDLRRTKELIGALRIAHATAVLNLANPNLQREAANLVGANIRVVKSSFGSAQPEELWRIAAQAEEDLVAFVHVQDSPDAFFLGAAAEILAADPTLAVVTCYDGICDAATGDIVGVGFAAGEHGCSAAGGLPVVGRLACVRKSAVVAARLPLDAQGASWDQLFYQMQMEGSGICVVPEVLNSTKVRVVPAAPAVVATRLSQALEGNGALQGSGAFQSASGVNIRSADAPAAETRLRATVSEITPVQRIWPPHKEQWGDPVSYNTVHGAWLIHPVDDAAVVARLHLPSEMMNARAYSIELANVSTNNHGALVRLVTEDFNWKETDVARWLEEKDKVAEGQIFVGPGERLTLGYDLPDGQRCGDLYIISRPRRGGHASHTPIMLYSYTAIFR